MPLYKFKCENCEYIESILCNNSEIDRFVSELECSVCHSKKFTRIFSINLVSSDKNTYSVDNNPNKNGDNCSGCTCGDCGSCGG